MHRIALDLVQLLNLCASRKVLGGEFIDPWVSVPLALRYTAPHQSNSLICTPFLAHYPCSWHHLGCPPSPEPKWGLPQKEGLLALLGHGSETLLSQFDASSNPPL